MRKELTRTKQTLDKETVRKIIETEQNIIHVQQILDVPVQGRD